MSPCSHVHKRQPMCERITLAERGQERNSFIFTSDLITGKSFLWLILNPEVGFNMHKEKERKQC